MQSFSIAYDLISQGRTFASQGLHFFDVLRLSLKYCSLSWALFFLAVDCGFVLFFKKMEIKLISDNMSLGKDWK